jgi:hypothetical protein
MNAPGPWHDLKNQHYLASEQFIEPVQAPIDSARPLPEAPQGESGA